MKIFLNIARLAVGILFIFSGLVKANDPLGLSYKMQEFFEVWNWHALNDYTLVFSVVMIAFEIIAGVAILLGWKMNLFIWLLLVLIIFFTFLTGYALFSGKIRECGCFGDCIPLQAHQSFIKDLILLVMIVVLFPYRNQIRPWASRSAAVGILLLTVLVSVGLQAYVLMHLPIVDCLPYKAGNNLPEKMKAPAGSIPDSTVIMFTYEKNGQQSSFTSDNFPADFDDSYTFVKREDKIVRKGNAVPAIRDFTLQTPSGNDTTLMLLNEPGYKLFFFLKDGFHQGSWVNTLTPVLDAATSKQMKSFLVTNLETVTTGDHAAQQVLERLFPLRADGTAIKTAARYNPTLFLLRQGTVVRKWSAKDLDKALDYLNKINP